MLADERKTHGNLDRWRSSGARIPVRIEEKAIVYTLKVRGGCEVDSKGKKAGKGALIQENLSATLGVSQDQALFVPKATIKQTKGER